MVLFDDLGCYRLQQLVTLLGPGWLLSLYYTLYVTFCTFCLWYGPSKIKCSFKYGNFIGSPFVKIQEWFQFSPRTWGNDPKWVETTNQLAVVSVDFHQCHKPPKVLATSDRPSIWDQPLDDNTAVVQQIHWRFLGEDSRKDVYKNMYIIYISVVVPTRHIYIYLNTYSTKNTLLKAI